MFQKMAIERSFRTSLIVLFLSELTAMAGSLIDGILIASFLGTLGVQAFGVVNPLLVAYNAIGSVFAVGSVSLCTRLLGKGKTDEAKGAFIVSFLWVLGLSIAVTIILLSISDPMIHLLGTAYASKELFAEARNYYIGITVSFPAINLMIHMTTYMQVDNDRRRALISTMVLTGVDIAGDLLSATVLDGGMLGMGLSTSIANYAALLVLLLHFHKRKSFSSPCCTIFPGIIPATWCPVASPPVHRWRAPPSCSLF